LKTKTIKLSKIKVDREFFLRFGYNRDAIDRYAELYESGSNKPIVVQKGTYKLVDGFHRYEALRLLGRDVVEVEELDIPDSEVRAEAFRRNRDHGVPLSKEERNKTIRELRFKDNKTQQEIAEIVGLSKGRVSQILGEKDESDISKLNTKQTNIDLREKADPKAVLVDWLKGMKQTAIAEDRGLTQPRVSQIIRDFKDHVHNQYLVELLDIDEIVKSAESDGIEISAEKVKEILREYDDINKDLLEIPRINCADLFDVIDNYPDKVFDLVYVDPPYSIRKDTEWGNETFTWDRFESDEEYWDFTERWVRAVLPKINDTGRLYISFSQEHFYALLGLMKDIANEYDMVLENILIWNYKNNMKPHDKRGYKRTWEPVLFFRKKGAGKLNLVKGKSWGESYNDYDVWEIPQPQSNFKADTKYHPAQKPLELLRRIILTGSKDGDIIFDPFAGAGTTGVVAKELGRQFYLIEKEPSYADIIKSRLGGVKLESATH